MFTAFRSTWHFRCPRRNLISITPVSFHLRLKSSGITPSAEQFAIVEALNRNNVIVSARPGSGKTATAEAVVKANPTSPILILTYSKRLQISTEKKLTNYPSAEVYTFHSFAGKLFGNGDIINNDYRLRELRRRSVPPVLVQRYEFIILDELQDMTPILYWLTCTLLSSLRSLPDKPKLLLLGDSRQAIYGYQGADARYLELAEETLSEYSPYPWQRCELAKSFRLTHETSKFVNTLVGENYIEGSRSGPRPKYIHYNPWKSMLLTLLARRIYSIVKKYSAEHCAIIAPSVKRNQILAELTNYLSEHYNVPVAEPLSDDGTLDPDVIRGKLTVSTFHQFKGSERKAVIVFGVDASFFRYIARNLPDDSCPNPIFVAVTRASEQLVVTQAASSAAAPFVRWEELMETCDFDNIAGRDPKPAGPVQRKIGPDQPINVTDLIRHIANEKLERLIEEHVEVKEVAERAEPYIDAPDKVKTSKKPTYHEAVTALNGIAVTAAFEWEVTGTCSLLGSEDDMASFRTDGPPQPQWFARRAAKHSSVMSGYRSRLNQLEKSNRYTWLDKTLPKTTACLLEQFDDKSLLRFEQGLQHKVMDKIHPPAFEPINVKGKIDILEYGSKDSESPTIWEIKFVSSLSREHIAQLVIYGFLWSAQKSKGVQQEHKFPRLVLYNVRDGAKWEISTTFAKASAFTQGILRAKNTIDEEVSKETFLERCKQVREEIAAGITSI